MRRFVLALTTLTAVALSTTVQAQTPAGWKLRIDRSTSASDPDSSGPIKFVKSGAGFHATNPQAAIYWNPANTATGSYDLSATFTLMKPSGHTNYYGLVFGGSTLDGAEQSYIYFMVAQDGTWLIKRRDGAQTPSVSQKTKSDAVKVPDASGQSVNALAIHVRPDKIEYLVNGTVVTTTPRTGLTANADGIYGIRVNHLLEVQIDNLAMQRR